jgi:predicted lipoprotein with Yx(FWY)xxD motif
MTMRIFLLLAVAAAAALVVTTSPMAAEQAAPTLTVHSSAFGNVLFDGRGFVLYAFTKDRRGRSVCAGACAKAWPPYVVRGSLRAGVGVKASLLRTIRRANGSRQVTYAGKPLYYYVGDKKPRQILCQNVEEFGGLWLVVRPSGKLVRSS